MRESERAREGGRNSGEEECEKIPNQGKKERSEWVAD